MSQNTEESQEQREARENRECQAIIDTAALGKPDLKATLTLDAVRILYRMPDSSLGWTEKNAPMSLDIRKLSVIMHLRIGALPGFKHLLWMGNGFYPTASFWTEMLSREFKNAKGEYRSVSAPAFRGLTDAEKKDWHLTDDDWSQAVEQTIKVGEFEQKWTGVGILGKDELIMLGGRPKAGTATVKDRMKTTKTRAMLDMYSRNYAIEGITVSAEDMADVIDTSFVAPLQADQAPQIAQPVMSEADKKELDKRADFQREWQRFRDLVQKVQALIQDPKDIHAILSIDDLDIWSSVATSEQLHDASDILDDWLSDHETPTPPSPPPPKTKAAAPKTVEAVKTLETGHIVDENGVVRTASGRKSRAKVGPDGKPRTRGRPPTKEETDAAEAASVLASISTAESTSIKLPEGLTVVHTAAEEITLVETPEAPAANEVEEDFQFFSADELDNSEVEADYFEDHAEDVQDDKFEHEHADNSDDAIYTGTEPQKDKLRRMAEAAGLTDNPSKFALAGGMSGRPMRDLPICIGGLLKASKAVKVEVKEFAPIPAVDKKALEQGKARLQKALSDVGKAEGAHMQITGTNTLNLMDGIDIEAINNAAAKLEVWLAEKAKAAFSPNTVTPKVSPASLVEFPETPAQGPGAPAFAMLRSAYSQTNNVVIRARITALAGRELKGGDHSFIPAALRLAGKGDFKELDALIAAREVRR